MPWDDLSKSNHENTKRRKHEKQGRLSPAHRSLATSCFAFSFFRVFVILFLRAAA